MGRSENPQFLDDVARDNLFATVSGGREGGAVSFEKTYESENPNDDIVQYEGQLIGSFYNDPLRRRKSCDGRESLRDNLELTGGHPQMMRNFGST